MANQQTLQGNWNEISGKIRSKWGQMTQDELQQFKGDSNQLVGMIQRKTGEARDKIESYLKELTEGGSGGISGAVGAAGEYANQAMESVRDSASQMADKVKERYSDVERTVQERPTESMAVAFGAGLVAGVILVMLLRD